MLSKNLYLYYVLYLILPDFLRVGSVIYNQLRFAANRPNIQRPKPPPFEKAKFLAVSKHIEPEDLRPPAEKCLKTVQVSPSYDVRYVCLKIFA